MSPTSRTIGRSRQMVDVRIVEAHDYDLVGEVVYELRAFPQQGRRSDDPGHGLHLSRVFLIPVLCPWS